jgi:hypothetical protein
MYGIEPVMAGVKLHRINILKASYLNSMIFGLIFVSALLALFSFSQSLQSSPALISIIEFLANLVFSVGFYFFVIGHENAKTILGRFTQERTEEHGKPLIFEAFKRSLVAVFAAFISGIIIAGVLGL